MAFLRRKREKKERRYGVSQKIKKSKGIVVSRPLRKELRLMRNNSKV
jgi:hypothetical protein